MERLGYGPRELARLLKISPNHIYGLIWRGELKAVRLGRRLLVPSHELERLGLVPKENPAEQGGER